MMSRSCWLVLAFAAALTVRWELPAAAQAPAPTKPDTSTETTAPAEAKAPSTPSKPAPVPPKRFGSPEEAVQAFVAALRAPDTKALLGILGSEGRTLVVSGDPVADQQSRETFLQAYDEGNKLVTSGTTATLQVGADDWPFPIPLVKQADHWRFDVREGREEILARRIGRNELNTIQTCLAYVDAQREYYATDHKGDGILEYARQFASTPGKRDGLYWPTSPGEQPSPLGDLVVRARAEGYRGGAASPIPFHGYLYRILKAQGPAAPGGDYDYVVRGHMIGGFGLVAFPAQYGVSGVMTFIVNHDGVVYQKDLGPGTRSTAFAMKKFNPDSTWTRAEMPEGATAAAPSR
jgi:hypothetical protein